MRCALIQGDAATTAKFAVEINRIFAASQQINILSAELSPLLHEYRGENNPVLRSGSLGGGVASFGAGGEGGGAAAPAKTFGS